MEDFRAAVARLRPSSLRGGLGVVTTHKIELSDIGGLGSIKQSLRTAIEWPLLYPEVFARFALPHTKGKSQSVTVIIGAKCVIYLSHTQTFSLLPQYFYSAFDYMVNTKINSSEN